MVKGCDAVCLSLHSCSSGLAGALSAFSTNHSFADDIWLWVFLLISVAGLVWALLVRCLLQRLAKYHKTHYKLSESEHLFEGGSVDLSGNLVMGSGGTGGGERGRGRERLKLAVQPMAQTTGSVASLPWRKTLRSPPVM